MIDMPTTHWKSTALSVPKLRTKAEMRLSVDLLPVKAAPVAKAWPMHHIESEEKELSDITCLCFLDFVSRYWQLAVHLNF